MNHQSLHLKWSMIHLQILKLDRPPPNTNFSSKKLCIVKIFLHDDWSKTKYFLLSTMKKKLLITKNIFHRSIRFLEKIENCHFSQNGQILGGGVFYPKIWLKMGGSALPFGGQQYYGKSGTCWETPPPKLQNWHGNKLEKRTWLGTTMGGFQWQTSYTNY